MTGKTNANGRRTARFRPSRRTLLAGALGSPALLGLAVGSYEAATRLGSDDDATAALVCPLDEGQDAFEGERTPVSIDPRVLSALDLEAGQQLRIRRTDDEVAAYTVAEERPEAPDDIVRMSATGRCRLQLANYDFPGVDGPCPGVDGTCSLADDDEFEATLSPTVPHPDLSIEEAKARGEFVERLDDRDAAVAVLAPHGGHIELRTDQQAVAAAEAADATCWRAMGWRPGGGSLSRWRIPSTEIDPASFPELDSIADADFDVAVSFNGLCEEGIEVGGTASDALRQTIADGINDALPSCATVAEPVDGFTSEDLLANRLGDEGVFLSQSWDVRRAYPDRIASGVAAALRGEVGDDVSGGC